MNLIACDDIGEDAITLWSEVVLVSLENWVPLQIGVTSKYDIMLLLVVLSI